MDMVITKGGAGRRIAKKKRAEGDVVAIPVGRDRRLLTALGWASLQQQPGDAAAAAQAPRKAAKASPRAAAAASNPAEPAQRTVPAGGSQPQRRASVPASESNPAEPATPTVPRGAGKAVPMVRERALQAAGSPTPAPPPPAPEPDKTPTPQPIPAAAASLEAEDPDAYKRRDMRAEGSEA